MNALFFEADSDPITKSVHQARRKALNSVPANPEYDLFGTKAYFSDVQSTHTSARTFGLISAMGHGGPGEFTGQWGTVLYDLSDTKSTNYTVVNSIVHIYSCDCGQQLGPYLVRAGAKAFIGYNNPVTVPNTQSVVEEFVKVAAVIDRSILSGDSSVTTKAKADAEFSKVMLQLTGTSSVATPRDVASFRLNHRSIVGPWTGAAYGRF